MTNKNLIATLVALSCLGCSIGNRPPELTAQRWLTIDHPSWPHSALGDLVVAFGERPCWFRQNATEGLSVTWWDRSGEPKSAAIPIPDSDSCQFLGMPWLTPDESLITVYCKRGAPSRVLSVVWGTDAPTIRELTASAVHPPFGVVGEDPGNSFLVYGQSVFEVFERTGTDVHPGYPWVSRDLSFTSCAFVDGTVFVNTPTTLTAISGSNTTALTDAPPYYDISQLDDKIVLSGSGVVVVLRPEEPLQSRKSIRIPSADHSRFVSISSENLAIWHPESKRLTVWVPGAKERQLVLHEAVGVIDVLQGTSSSSLFVADEVGLIRVRL
jgi:hypothetical protein